MLAVLRELKLAGRRLRHRWKMTALVIATIGLALGANTAMFSVFNRLVLHPLAYPAPSQLVWLQPVNVATGRAGENGFSIPDYWDLRRLDDRFAALAAYFPNVATLVGRGDPQHVAYANVSGDFFRALGVKPALGRWITRADEVPSLPEVAVLGNGLWRSRFGANPHVLGQKLDLDNRLLTIIGVMPPGFAYPQATALWTPEPMESRLSLPRNWRFMPALGRLKPGVSVAQAQQQISAIAARLARRYPNSNSNQGVRLVPLAEWVSGPMRATLVMMLIAGLLVLALACANVANLLLASAVGRGREMALRSSLGATRLHLLGQLLAEGTVLAGLGAFFGWMLALVLLPILRSRRPPELPQLAGVTLDWRVLAFTAAITVVTAVWFALAPAWELLRPGAAARNLHRAASPQPSRSRLPGGVVAAEVATTCVLLVIAGLFWQSLRRLERISPGFNPAGVLTFRTSLLYNSLAELDAGQPFFRRLDRDVRRLPGVEAASLTSELPFVPPETVMHFYPAGSPLAARRVVNWPQAGERVVMPGYFAALGIPLRGRDFRSSDGAHAARVVILNRSLARRLFPSANALGRSLVLASGNARINARIIGIAGDVAATAPGGPPENALYSSLLQLPRGEMSMVVHTRGDPWQLMPALRREVAALNPDVPIYQQATLAQRVAVTTAPDRFRAALLAMMAALATVLAMAGLYGVLAHSVAQRRHEFGIRLALGATAGQVRGMVLGQSMRLTVAGLALGLALAWMLRASLDRFLFPGSSGLSLTWFAVPLLLLAAAFVASYLPALHATRVDPARTLRE
jgi:predicted permease